MKIQKEIFTATAKENQKEKTKNRVGINYGKH